MIYSFFFFDCRVFKNGFGAAGNDLWQKVGREFPNNVNAISLIMYTLSSISDKDWQHSLAEEDGGQIKQFQLKIADVTSAGSLLSAVWLIGRHLQGPGKWTHTEEHTHTRPTPTHTHREPADCQMCHGWGQRRALQTLVRGEGKQLLRAGSGKQLSVQPWWGKHGCALSPCLLKLHPGRKKETFSSPKCKVQHGFHHTRV